MRNKIYLQLFAEGAGEAGGAAVETGLEGQSDQQTVQVQTDTGEESTEEDRGTKWKNMIKGEFKDEYNQSVQKVINDRFKQTKEMEERLSSSQKVLDFVAQRYGLDKTADADDMLRALEEDDSMFEERAMAKGMSTEQYREFYRLEKQNEEFRRAAEETQRIRQADETYSKWMSEADALKEIYPDFSFDEEVENKDFLQLLQNGIDVRTAYEVAHHDEIMRGAMQMASAKTAERVTDGIRAKGLRPAENGTNTSSKPVEQKIDISKLTAKDIDELSKRAARGEKITF